MADEGQELTGLELARLYFHEVVAPLVERTLPGRRYSAGLLGDCSDVLGLDDAVSRDHGWGPRCVLLLDDAAGDLRRTLNAALAAHLPLRFRGYPTSYRDLRLDAIAAPPVAHWVDLYTPGGFLAAELGIDDPARLGARDWLAMPPHKLLGVTAGALFRDDLDFARARRALAAYPDDVRLVRIAAEWMQIADEQAFPARAGSRGDEAGSAIIAARLAEHLMRLCFHLERRYAPYSKWFGSAFLRLAGSADIREPIARMVTAPDWQARDRHWAAALGAVITLHERHGVLEAGKYSVAPVYLGRPGTGLPQVERGPASIATLIDEVRAQIVDPEARAVAAALEPA